MTHDLPVSHGVKRWSEKESALVDLSGNREVLRQFVRSQERRGLSKGTIVATTKRLEALFWWLARQPVLTISRQDVEKFLDTRRIGPKTRYNYLATFHSLFQWAIEEEMTDVDPTSKIQRPKMRRALSTACGHQEARAGPAVGQSHDALVDAPGGLAGPSMPGDSGPPTGGHHRGGGPVAGGARQGWQREDVAASPRCAVGPLGAPDAASRVVVHSAEGRKYTPHQLSRVFNDFLRDAAVGASAHQLRHWFASELYRSTQDIRLVQEMLGHSSPEITANLRGL